MSYYNNKKKDTNNHYSYNVKHFECRNTQVFLFVVFFKYFVLLNLLHSSHTANGSSRKRNTSDIN